MLLLLSLVGGGAAGWAYADTSDAPPVSQAAPSPVGAADPELPSSPEGVYAPNADLPPVSTSLRTRPARIGTPQDGGIVIPAPVDWERTYLPGLESKWMARTDQLGSYQVRVERLVGENRTADQMVAGLVAQFPFDQSVTEFEPIQQTFDTLVAAYTYTSDSGDRYRRLTIVTWVSFSGGLVDVEIAATGRIEDRAGMERLVSLMARDVEPQPMPQKPGNATSASTS